MRVSWSSLILAALLPWTLAACGSSGQQQGGTPPPPEVGVVTVQPGNVSLQRDLVGRLSAFRSADVRARVPGVLRKRLYAEGSDVTAGQPLFQIDPASLQAALDAAQASLAAAKATYTNAHVAADRARSLAPGKFIAKSDLDNALAAERSAQAAMQQAQANAQAARINLGYADVRAPIAGRAGQQQVTEGALVGQGDATLLTTVEQIDPVYANFSIGAGELQKLRDMQSNGDASLSGAGSAQVRVTLPDGTVYDQPGVLDFAAAAVDPATGAIELRARIPNPKRVLLPGLYVRLNASMGELKNVYLVPQAALQRDAIGPFVLVVGSDGKVVRRDVVADSTHGSDWVISQGLQPGEQVIVSGIPKVQPGASAKATPWQPPAAAGSSAGDAGKPPGKS
ncbi:MAG: efflux RND transporter periplasmic adaptor subunit [Proteobacteria bacterium]|nr:efflux RND transporter periplasmic adaptor subunit [Pseudomonadota bacterium]